MNGFSKHVIVGTCGRDPEFKLTAKGTAMCSASLAVNTWNPTAREAKTSWHYVLAFGKQAEILKNARKGEAVYIEGRIESEQRDGQTYFTTIVNEVRVIGKQGGRGRDTGADAVAEALAEQFSAKAPEVTPKSDDSAWSEAAVAAEDIPF